MLRPIRVRVIENLWQYFRSYSPQIHVIETALAKKGITKIPLDHCAIIDLPGPHSGISQLSAIFSAIGYKIQGKDYLADKQNTFVWLSENEHEEELAINMLPQVVVADFRLDELPIEVRKIISKYSQKIAPFPQSLLEKMLHSVTDHNQHQIDGLLQHYFAGRAWSLPTLSEFSLVHEFNELLAWVLVHGRKPNHFSLSIHLLKQFSTLETFNDFIVNEVQLTLNSAGGVIKGGKHAGIAQSGTLGVPQIVSLQDGDVEIPSAFVEFVFRYPRHSSLSQPTRWQDYFTGFVANNADHVIESVYTRLTP